MTLYPPRPDATSRWNSSLSFSAFAGRGTVWKGIAALAVVLAMTRAAAADSTAVPTPPNRDATPPSVATPAPEPVFVRVNDIAYYPEGAFPDDDEHARAQCRLDVYHPENTPGFATVVWFPGGGLTTVRRRVPTALSGGRYAVVAAGYRLYPHVREPAPMEDAAAAVAWTLDNIARFGGDPERVFISGHSAGGYLATMIALDPRYLARFGHNPGQLAGVMPISGQMTTHFRVMQSLDDDAPVRIDEFAPLRLARRDAPPFLLVVGDPAVEWPARVEENALLAATLRRLGHPQVEYHSLSGFDHGQVIAPGQQLARQYMARRLRAMDAVKAEAAKAANTDPAPAPAKPDDAPAVDPSSPTPAAVALP